MPGVTGASMLSSRPARGYRFHSLQVEIIVILSRNSRQQSVDGNPAAASFCSRKKRLNEKSVPQYHRKIPAAHLPVTAYSAQSTGIVNASDRPRLRRGSDHDVANGSQGLPEVAVRRKIES